MIVLGMILVMGTVVIRMVVLFLVVLTVSPITGVNIDIHSHAVAMIGLTTHTGGGQKQTENRNNPQGSKFHSIFSFYIFRFSADTYCISITVGESGGTATEASTSFSSNFFTMSTVPAGLPG